MDDDFEFLIFINRLICFSLCGHLQGAWKNNYQDWQGYVKS